MKKLLMLLLLAFLVTACSHKETESVQPKEDEMIIQYIIESEEICRVDFVSDLNGKYLRMGGFADFDRKTLKGNNDIYISYSHQDIELNKEWDNGALFEGIITQHLHLYDKNEDEIAVIDNLTIPVEPGTVKKIIIEKEGNDYVAMSTT